MKLFCMGTHVKCAYGEYDSILHWCPFKHLEIVMKSIDNVFPKNQLMNYIRLFFLPKKTQYSAAKINSRGNFSLIAKPS